MIVSFALSPQMRKVLLVDGSAVVRERLTEFLSELDGVATVGQAADALTGKQLAEQLRPDVIILDLPMFTGRGMDFLRDIKRINPAPSVVVLTNDSYPENRQMCLDGGADYFLDKSTEFQELARVLTGTTHERGTKRHSSRRGWGPVPEQS